ncbi:guanine deaminase [Eremomyces bilateralis CBS 781.70]|uniref:Guanine deaminase n=1 Tax=Eremomyces bilateralis CBS 781.70 TaxID=1392243 RepID=A0A6G1G9F1_9PEZI|nr:guanine deaminase [Eremomyces bilateralis CBS 781.70]KAF1814707.1 guanine deaminase [Eremomyces bilateralis CBS 781.70]
MSEFKNGTKKVFVGPFVQSKTLKELEICKDGIIGVDEEGRIAFVERSTADVEAALKLHGWEKVEVIRLKENGFYFPGFIDTHIHASQYPNAGIFGKSTLLDWLNTYTFPLEASFSDVARARAIYNRVVSRTLSHGTTTAAYYATIHVAATNLLADICLAHGQRAFIGRVCMDSAIAPDFYKDESAAQALAATRESIAHIRNIDPTHAIVSPIITPRFAPACSPDCLAQLGELHRETGYPAQTHISENMNEVKLVGELFPDARSYAHVYDDAGLLTDKMILAHAVHLNDDEVALVKARDAKISHCPASNTALTSGTAKVRKYLDYGIDVGLGTDVSGGFSPSVLEVVKQAVWVSRHVAMEAGDAVKLSTEEALYLATRGGAKVVGLAERIGGFEVGMDWDAQMVLLNEVQDMEGHGEDEGPVDHFGWESWEDKVAKWVYNGDDRNTVAVWVKGRLVHKTSRYQS